MGFFKGLKALSDTAAEARRNHDPVADARAANLQMQELTAAFRSANAVVAGDPVDAVGGRVQVVSVGAAVAMVNIDPVFAVEVVVLADGAPPVATSTKLLVPAARVVRVQPGASLPARISRHDPTSFSICWDQP